MDCWAVGCTYRNVKTRRKYYCSGMRGWYPELSRMNTPNEPIRFIPPPMTWGLYERIR